MARPRNAPASARGQAILDHIDKLGLTITGAAAKAGVSPNVISEMVARGNGDHTSLRVAALLVERLGLPLKLLCPALARATEKALARSA